MKTWEIWLRGLAAAIISAGANATTLVIVSPSTFNFSHGGLHNLGAVVLASAIVGAALYLKQSPVPK